MRFVVGAITGCQRSAQVHPCRLRITSFADGDYKLFKRFVPRFIDGPSPYSGCLVSIKENPAKYFLLTGLSHTCLYSVFVFQPVSSFSLFSLIFLFFPHISSSSSTWRLCHALSPPSLFVSAGLILIDHSHRSKPLLCLRSRYHREQDGDVNDTLPPFFDVSTQICQHWSIPCVPIQYMSLTLSDW